MQPETATTTSSSAITKHLRIEESPVYGTGKLSFHDDRLFSSLAHLFAIVIWPWKSATSPAVDAHGKEALNVAITWLAIMLPLSVILGFLPALLARILGIGVSLLGLLALVLAIYGFILARQGKLLRYPLNLRLIK